MVPVSPMKLCPEYSTPATPPSRGGPHRTADGRPRIAGWAGRSAAPSLKKPAAACTPPTALRVARASKLSCRFVTAEAGHTTRQETNRDAGMTWKPAAQKNPMQRIVREANTMLETVMNTRAMEFIPQLAEPQIRLHLLVVDSDAAIRSACAEIASSVGYAVESTGDLGQARSQMRGRAADILLVNLPSGSNQGLELVAEVKLLYPQTSVIAMTASGSVNAAVEAMRCGASAYLAKPFAMDELSTVLDRAAASLVTDTATRQLRERLRLSQGLSAMIGRSGEMEKLYRILSKVAQSSHPVLILGESGTGKELVARTIHAYGPNSQKPFLPVDCGSLVPTLIESELFGYVKGAFTGANRSKDGLLVSAEGGTVFLDEIGELSLDLQAKLLRALQEKEVRPVGATHRIPIKARIVAATNRDLATMVVNGTFRKDLFYRLNVVNLRLPPLRDRREDIPLLAAHFLDRISREHGRSEERRVGEEC